MAPKSKDVPLYFAFADGVYDYVCAECTALCCKGHGFGGSLQRELRPLFARYPHLETLAISRTGDEMLLMTSASGCVMLDPDNRCRIEKELGKDKKPTICNLFPFNAFARIGRTVTVSPHFLCPLRLVLPLGSKKVQGVHEEIKATIQQSQILDRVYLKARVRRLPMHPSLNESQTIQIESEFRQKCADAFGKYSFQEILTDASSEPESLAQFVERSTSVLGLPGSATRSHDHLDDLLLAFAPVHRLSLLSLGPEGMLRALAVAELIMRRAWSTGPQITLQTVANTVAQFLPTEMLLATADARFEFGKLNQKAFAYQGPEITFAAFQVLREASQFGVLRALERAIEPSLPVSDRSILLLQLGRLMEEGKLRQKAKRGRAIDKTLSQSAM